MNVVLTYMLEALLRYKHEFITKIQLRKEIDIVPCVQFINKIKNIILKHYLKKIRTKKQRKKNNIAMFLIKGYIEKHLYSIFELVKIKSCSNNIKNPTLLIKAIRRIYIRNQFKHIKECINKHFADSITFTKILKNIISNNLKSNVNIISNVTKNKIKFKKFYRVIKTPIYRHVIHVLDIFNNFTEMKYKKIQGAVILYKIMNRMIYKIMFKNMRANLKYYSKLRYCFMQLELINKRKVINKAFYKFKTNSTLIHKRLSLLKILILHLQMKLKSK